MNNLHFYKSRIFGIAIVLLFSLGAAAQSTPKALQEMTNKMQALKTFSVQFDYMMADSATAERVAQSGTLTLSNKKYRLDFGNMLIVFDGKARYTFLKAENEVTISVPDVLQDGIFADPSAIFAINYSDFTIRQKSETVLKNHSLLVFELLPKQKETPYKKIFVSVDKDLHLPSQIAYHGSDARTTIISLDLFDTKPSISPADFAFDAKQYPDIEVVDMR